MYKAELSVTGVHLAQTTVAVKTLKGWCIFVLMYVCTR